jgi:adenylate cyclase
MAQEIERKFLVLNDLYKSSASRSFRIRQGYLSSNPERSVRVRIKGDSGFLTIKGASDPTGISRYEWEKMIPVNEAEELLCLCEPGAIDKVRYEIKFGNHIFEVDEFFGENLGLVVAELELTSEDEKYQRPDWLGREVTGELKYYNSQLARRPYNLW